MMMSNSPHPVSVTSNGGFSITTCYDEHKEDSWYVSTRDRERNARHCFVCGWEGGLHYTSGELITSVRVVVGIVQLEGDLADEI